MQRANRLYHPHKATIDDLIVEIKGNQRNRHEIIVTMDGTEGFSSFRGGIAKLCRECKIYDVFGQCFKNVKLSNTHVKVSKRIDYILCCLNILTIITQSGMTAFGELVTSDHRELYIDIPTLSLLKPHTLNFSQSFQRTLKSSCPRSIKK